MKRRHVRLMKKRNRVDRLGSVFKLFVSIDMSFARLGN